jgi:hypothetical protein
MLASRCGNCFYVSGECLVFLLHLRLVLNVGDLRCDVLHL